MVVLLFYDAFSELVYGTQSEVASGLERPCYLLHLLAAAVLVVHVGKLLVVHCLCEQVAHVELHLPVAAEHLRDGQVYHTSRGIS